jgi:hypothetical protein
MAKAQRPPSSLKSFLIWLVGIDFSKVRYMKKLAQDLKPGERVRPFLDERNFKRTKKTVEIVGGPHECDGAFQGIYIMFQVLDKGVRDEILLQHEDEVEVV